MPEIFSPLVQDTTKAQSESVETILARLKSGRVYVPDYQRDAEQWDQRKKSLFIESLLNNLTIPAFFFCEDESRNYEVVDGQQRLTTIWRFAEDKFSISNDPSIDYISPDAALYAGKKYTELSPGLRNILNDYPLTIIYLPKSIPLQTKLEIFRRINEGGTPLSGQDIRLAYYSQSKSVTFIRLVGIHENTAKYEDEYSKDPNSSDSNYTPYQRMMDLGKKLGLSNPWNRFPDAGELWYNWWEGKDKAKGQTPSLMFLWYLICLERKNFDALLKRIKHLPISFSGSTENALDIYCSQLQFQEKREKSSENLDIISDFEVIAQDYFPKFAGWMEAILSQGLSGISVDKYKQLALFIAGAVELKIIPNDLTNSQWNEAGEFIRKPRERGKKILNEENGYPESKGKWSGQRGQKEQCDKAVEIAKRILCQ